MLTLTLTLGAVPLFGRWRRSGALLCSSHRCFRPRVRTQIHCRQLQKPLGVSHTKSNQPTIDRSNERTNTHAHAHALIRASVCACPQVREGSEEESEKLCIFGNPRARRGAELKVMVSQNPAAPFHRSLVGKFNFLVRVCLLRSEILVLQPLF